MIFLAYRLIAWSSLLVILIIYPLIAWTAMRLSNVRIRLWVFALVNLWGAYALCATSLIDKQHTLGPLLALFRVVAFGFAGYVVLVLLHYWMLRRVGRDNGTWYLLALWFPIVVLICIKYVPTVQNSFSNTLRGVNVQHLSALFLGLSYLAFRNCHLVQEVRNDVIEVPTIDRK